VAAPEDDWQSGPVEEAEPAFYRLHLADRKMMTSCLLFGVNPLLALTPPELVLYWPLEIHEALEDARASEQQTGSLLIGAGANSASELTGNVVLVYELPEAPAAVSVCPYLNRPQPTPAPLDLGKERTVLDNLQALEESDRLFESAREMMRTGRLCEALDFFEKITRLCPGSRYAEMADALVAEVFKHFPAAAEKDTEPSTIEERLRVYDTPLTHIFSDLFNGEGLNFYLQNPPAPQEEESEEQEAPNRDAKRLEHELEPGARVMLTVF